ncbi:MAG TPA: dihydrolipoyl dehydrogenase [Kurthia sp.]
MAKEYDLVILGGGPAGYVAAIRASQLKLKVAIVEQAKLGGTCLHKGCIPTKALLKSSEKYNALTSIEDFGITFDHVEFDYKKAHTRKNDVVEQLHSGIQSLMKKGKIDVFTGTGRILGPSIFSPLPGTVSVDYGEDQENEMLVPKNLLVCTGSKPRQIPSIEIDEEMILTSDGLVKMEELPKSMAIIGGGVIGIEWASIMQDLGVEVTIIEAGDSILPTEDHDIVKELTKSFKAKNTKILVKQSVESCVVVDQKVQIKCTDQQLEVDKVVIAIGRKPNTNGIGLENTDAQLDSGFIKVNKNFQTKESHIYAAGDVIGGIQLAHVASKEAIHAVEHMAGLKPTINDTAIPSCIYSYPEIAHIGLTEKEAKEKHTKIKVKKFPFIANAKALINGQHEGFVKMIVDADTDDLLGVHLIGDHVTELIAEMSLAFTLDASSWEVGQTIHPHPSVSEVMQEVALSINDGAIHF